MEPEVRDRRKETWKLLEIEGATMEETVARIAGEYAVSESEVESDLNHLMDWLPKIDQSAREANLSLLYELKENRQRLYQMAEEAREEENPDLELEIRQSLIDAIKLEGNLSKNSETIRRSPATDQLNS